MRKPEPKEYPVQPRGWRKKYKCHKNKADHTFVVVYAWQLNWKTWNQGKIFEESVCTACGKKKIDIV